MAKKEKETATASVATPSVDNIENAVRDQNLAKDLTLGEKALKELGEEADERIKNQLKKRIKRAQYDQLRTLVELKHDRACSEIRKEKLKDKNFLLNNLVGFTATGDEQRDGSKHEKGEVVKPSLTSAEYDEKLRELANATDKKVREANEKRDKLIRELRDSFGMWYEWDWDRY